MSEICRSILTRLQQESALLSIIRVDWDMVKFLYLREKEKTNAKAVWKPVKSGFQLN